MFEEDFKNHKKCKLKYYISNMLHLKVQVKSTCKSWNRVMFKS